MRKHRAPQVQAIETIVERLANSAGDNPVRQRILSEARRVHSAGVALDNAYLTRNPTVTPAAHTKDVGQKARKYNQETTAALNRVIAAIHEGRADVERRIAEKVNLKPPTNAEEFRTVFRSLSQKAKVEQLKQWVDGNNGPELAAIVDSHAFLTGLDRDAAKRFREAIVAKHAPAELEEIEMLNDADGSFNAISRAQTDFAKSLADPAELARIEREEAAADDAARAFDEALSQQ